MKRRKLGEILLEAGAINPRQLAEALDDQRRYGGKLGMILLERGFITEKDFFTALSSQLRIPAIDFTKSTIPENVIRSVPQELAEKLKVFPVAQKTTPQGRVLVLAMADPTDVTVQDEIRFTTGLKVEPVISLESIIAYALNDYYYHQNGKGPYRMDEAPEDLALDNEPVVTRTSAPQQVDYVREVVAEEDEPQMLMRGPEREKYQEKEETLRQSSMAAEDKPHLTRELRALMKLLAKKGIITPKEYLDEFKKTE